VNLIAGFVFCVAPRFHSRLAWSDRLRTNGGVQCVAGRFYPRDDWRQPTAAELALLLGRPAATGWDSDAMLPPTHAALFTVPPHVRAAWWAVAERSKALDAAMDGYDGFVAGLVEFLRFKRLPLPERCQFDVVASRPGQLSTRLEPTAGSPTGLDFSCACAAPGHPARRLVAIINFGDEVSHLVLLNLPRAGMARLANIDDASPSTLCADFLAARSAYPLVRVQLEPGDGFWLPEDPVVCDGDTQEKREIDIVMTIHTAG